MKRQQLWYVITDDVSSVTTRHQWRCVISDNASVLRCVIWNLTKSFIRMRWYGMDKGFLALLRSKLCKKVYWSNGRLVGRSRMFFTILKLKFCALTWTSRSLPSRIKDQKSLRSNLHTFSPLQVEITMENYQFTFTTSIFFHFFLYLLFLFLLLFLRILLFLLLLLPPSLQ